MKRDIRTLFENKTLATKQLPDNHRAEFLNKLKKANNKKKKPKQTYFYYKIAASILVLLAMAFFISRNLSENSKPESMELVDQIKTVEQHYLAEINKEWENFLALTTDTKLVNRYKERLKSLDVNYKALSKDFKNDTSNVLVIEDLIENLKTRLQLLKDIQQHIKLLNSKNNSYENVI